MHRKEGILGFWEFLVSYKIKIEFKKLLICIIEYYQRNLIYFYIFNE